MDDKSLIRKSKFLSLVLRHRPELIGISLDQNGWTEVTALLEKSAAKGTVFSLNELKAVVENNNKQRFAFNEDQTMIRANQGHSVKINLGYEATNPPDILFHGTAEKNLSSILKLGINKRNRHHVHLSSDEATAKAVGSRHGNPVILIIKAKAMSDQGIQFYQSENGVWLTEFVAAKYIYV